MTSAESYWQVYEEKIVGWESLRLLIATNKLNRQSPQGMEIL